MSHYVRLRGEERRRSDEPLLSASITRANSEPVVEPFCRVVEKVLSGVGILCRGYRAVGARANAGHRAFDDDEIFVGAF